ncbi:carbohydrate-binding module family 14 protein [Streptomyces clavuligerus]|nr:carbohydrate-binding module family 14 protein [Streptomyces clavuligerus]WDN57503.1 carbohydrate-binding module family 14 protein [Streptomyces clavuligerus]
MRMKPVASVAVRATLALAVLLVPLTMTAPAAHAKPNPICGGDYYGPFPGDRTKFFQCDDFGAFFVMDCAPGTEFDDSLNVCVYATPRPGGTVPAAAPQTG